MKGPRPVLYLFTVLAWTWFFLSFSVITGSWWLSFPLVLLTVTGVLGPVIVSLIFIRLGFWDEDLDKTAAGFLLRCFHPGTLQPGWYGKIFLLIMVLSLLPAILDSNTRTAEGLISIGPGIFLLTGIIIGGLEEAGWRGYAQEALQKRISVLSAGLIIGVFWALWHLPLFFIAGTYQSGLGAGTPEFAGFFIALIAGSVIHSWLYNRTGKVIFASVFFHAFGNAAYEIVTDAAPVYRVSVEAAAAGILVIISWSWISRSQP